MSKDLLTGLGLISIDMAREVSAEKMLRILSGLSLLEKLVLRLRGSVLVEWVSFDGWREKLPFYIFKCPIHGYQLSYPQGFHKALVCPKCFESAN